MIDLVPSGQNHSVRALSGGPRQAGSPPSPPSEERDVGGELTALASSLTWLPWHRSGTLIDAW